MLLQRLLPQSLKSRVTLLTLVIVVLGFLALSSYVKSLLRDELMLYTGAQQRSALKLLGAEVTRGLQNRLELLSAVAADVAPTQLKDPGGLQVSLQERALLDMQFNAGVSIWSAQAERLASHGAVLDRAVVVQDLTQLLQDGQPRIGRMTLLSDPKTAVFSMYAPIRDSGGAVIGAAVGSIRLDQPNFVSALASHRYGKSGNFFLIEAAQRLIIATSDTSRVFETLPARGVIPWIDRFVDGFEGTARVVNPHGVEVLVSIEQIPMAHWYASVTLTPDEVFALIEAIKPGGRVTALGLVTISLILIWLMLRWQLSPMTAAAKMLDGFVRRNQAPQALPVVRHDEVGQLVGGFNRLLEAVAQQKKAAHESELFKQAVLNSVTSAIAVLDHDGLILSINDTWTLFSSEFNTKPGSTATELGANFFAACEGLPVDTTLGHGMTAQDGVRAVLEGQLPHFLLEYSVLASASALAPLRWRSMSVTPFKGALFKGAVVSLEDITARMEMERQVRDLASYDTLTKLPNRRLAQERLTQLLARARRNKSRLALLFIDLDRFKPINDELGHEVGDWLLQAVAQRIQSCVRESDTAARMGGDEFVVLLPDLQIVDSALIVAEKVRNRLEQDFVTPKGAVLQISSSIGVAIYPDHGDSEETLMRFGDEAMYKAKKGGRNAVQVWQPPATDQSPTADHAGRVLNVHLRWKPAFASGHPEIDQEHEALFDLANQLLDAAAIRESKPVEFEQAFETLLTHVTEHFANEEAILRAYGYADLEAHAQLHRRLLERARQLHVATHATGADGADGLIGFLLSELVAGHMLGADRAFASLFRADPT